MIANITRRLGTKKLTKVNTYVGGMGRGYPKVDIIFHKNIDELCKEIHIYTLLHLKYHT